jgi:hypothetical protein
LVSDLAPFAVELMLDCLDGSVLHIRLFIGKMRTIYQNAWFSVDIGMTTGVIVPLHQLLLIFLHYFISLIGT